MAGNFLPSAVGDGEGGEGGINQPYQFSTHDKGKWLLGDTEGEKQNLLSEKALSLPGPVTLGGTKVDSQCRTEDFNFGKIYPIGNKRRSPLHFKSNWTEHVYGKKRELRKSNWAGKSLTVEVNGKGERRVAWKKGGLRSSIWVSRDQRDHVVGSSSVSRVHKPVVGLDQDGSQVGLPMIPFLEPTGPSRMEEGVSPSVGDLSLLNKEAHASVMSKAPHAILDAQDITGFDVFLAEESPAPLVMAGTARQHDSKSATSPVGQSVMILCPAKAAVVNRGPFSNGFHAGDSPVTLDRADLAAHKPVMVTSPKTGHNIAFAQTKVLGRPAEPTREVDGFVSSGFHGEKLPMTSGKADTVSMGKAVTKSDRVSIGLFLSNLFLSLLRAGIAELGV